MTAGNPSLYGKAKQPPRSKTPKRRRRRGSRGKTKGGFKPVTIIRPQTAHVRDAGRDTDVAGTTYRFSLFKYSQNGDFSSTNPHWWRRLKASQPYGRVTIDFGTPNWAIWSQYHSLFQGCWWNMPDIAPWVNTVDSELCYFNSLYDDTYQIAFSKLMKKLKDSDLMLAVDVAEGRKSISMVEKRLSEVIQIARQVRRKAFHISRVNPNDPSKTPWAVIGNTWLEYQYGWKPLLGSAFGLADAMKKRSEKISTRVEAKYHLKRLRVMERRNALGIRGVVEQYASTRVKFSCDYIIDNPFARDASRFVGLNPLSLLWELLPYSFVVDWFVDIGGYLEAWEQCQMIGGRFIRGFRSEVHDVSNNINIIPGYHTANGRTHLVEGVNPFQQHQREKNRVKLDDFPRPNFPKFDPKLGAARIASGAALLSNILTNFNRRDRFNDRVGFDAWGPGWKFV